MHSAFDCIKVETVINTCRYISPTAFLIELYFQSTWTFKEDTLRQTWYIANQEIKNVSQWWDSNKLTLNVSKTNFMIFKTRKKIIVSVRIIIKDKSTYTWSPAYQGLTKAGGSSQSATSLATRYGLGISDNPRKSADRFWLHLSVPQGEGT